MFEMLENMLKNCGKKIQRTSTIFLTVGWIAVFFLAIAFGIDRWDPLLFVAILAGGAIAVYVDALLLNGFGLIVENSEAQKDAMEMSKIAKKREAKKDAVEMPKIVENSIAKKDAVEMPQKEISADREEENLNKRKWMCVCGRMNPYFVTQCACGKDRLEGEVKNQQ